MFKHDSLDQIPNVVTLENWNATPYLLGSKKTYPCRINLVSSKIESQSIPITFAYGLKSSGKCGFTWEKKKSASLGSFLKEF